MVEIPHRSLWETLEDHPEQQFLGVGVCVANVLECPKEPGYRRWHSWAVAIDYERLVDRSPSAAGWHSTEAEAKRAAYIAAVEMDNEILRQLPEEQRHMKYPCEIEGCPCRELVPVYKENED